MWNKLGSKYFLMPDPRKVSFTTGVFLGGKKGSTWKQDEYGRIPNDHDKTVKKNRDKEWRTFQAYKDSWNAIYRELTSKELLK